MVKIRNVIGVGTGIALVSLALSAIWRTMFPTERILQLGGATATFSTMPLQGIDVDVRNQILTGVKSDFVSQTLSTLGGGAIAGAGIIMTIVASILVVLVGKLLVESFPQLQFAKKPIGKMTLVLFYGSVAIGLISGLVGQSFGLPAMGVMIAMALYFTLVGWIYALLKSQFKRLPDLD
tara:strand:+ start:471 stop:1007 length:537 start_codon:yes stop_codon:yes gene_type:complete